MEKHPNEFSRRIILRFFAERRIPIKVNAVASGYVVFFHHFSAMDGCVIEDPAGRLVFDRKYRGWRLFWMSGDARWHLYGRYDRLHQALDAMVAENAANLFSKVL